MSFPFPCKLADTVFDMLSFNFCVSCSTNYGSPSYFVCQVAHYAHSPPVENPNFVWKIYYCMATQPPPLNVAPLSNNGLVRPYQIMDLQLPKSVNEPKPSSGGQDSGEDAGGTKNLKVRAADQKLCHKTRPSTIPGSVVSACLVCSLLMFSVSLPFLQYFEMFW